MKHRLLAVTLAKFARRMENYLYSELHQIEYRMGSGRMK